MHNKTIDRQSSLIESRLQSVDPAASTPTLSSTVEFLSHILKHPRLCSLLQSTVTLSPSPAPHLRASNNFNLPVHCRDRLVAELCRIQCPATHLRIRHGSLLESGRYSRCQSRRPARLGVRTFQTSEYLFVPPLPMIGGRYLVAKARA